MKGAAVASTRDDLMGLLADGRLDRATLEARLDAAALALVDGGVAPDAWIPVAGYERLLRLLLEVEGRGDPEYLVQRGHRSVDSIMRAGVDRQLAHADRFAARGVRRGEVGEGWFERAGHALVTLPSALFSAGRWRLFQGDDRRLFTLEGDALGHLPMNVARVVEGALADLAGHLAGRPVAVVAKPHGPGRIVFVGTAG